MKIALLGYAHPFGEETRYGAERVIYYLMQELKKQGHTCVAFSPGNCKLPGFDFVELERPWSDTEDLYYAAIKKYESDKNIKFDMVHSFQASGFIDPRLRSEYSYCLEPFFQFTAFKENIIAYSRLVNHRNGGDSTVIYLGLPKDHYKTYSKTHKDYLVWMGRIDPGKGTANAIEIAKRAGKKLIIMGPAYNYPYFYDHVWPHVDNKNVIWLRGVDDVLKKRVLRNALATIHPIWDKYHEMFGLTNIESLAMGVPVIGWNNVEQPSAIGFDGGETIYHGVQGFIINHNDYSEAAREGAIQESVNVISQLGNISRQACRALFQIKFTSERYANQTLQYYALIKERGQVLNVTDELK